MAQDIKVLLVDDDAFQRDMISGILESLGVSQITQVASGDQALQKLAGKHGFNLLLLDLHMPGMDGFQFMESLVKADYTGALIIVSGQSDEVLHAASMVAKLRRFNVLGSVPKPVGRAALSALLDKMP
jgi:CheY-like chemotaxis protein